MRSDRLSKSKLLAYRQCPRRLWLEIRCPELAELSATTRARFTAGHEVGAIARRLYDPSGEGVSIDVNAEGIARSLERTRELLGASRPMFEAGVAGGGAFAFADIMLPGEARNGAWRIIEVKSSTKVKDYHRDDIAIQAYAACEAGIRLESVEVACIDSSWFYGGDQDYRGLLYETDLTAEAMARVPEVRTWIEGARGIAESPAEPEIETGPQCTEPFPCPFQSYCGAGAPEPEYPSAWLPRVQRADLRRLIEGGASDMRDIPDELLNDVQLRVKRQSLAGEPWVRRGRAKIEQHRLPAFFMDFETVQFAVPIWPGTRPYQQIPFQFSVHRLPRTGPTMHQEFLDLSGSDPSRAFAEALLAAVEDCGPVFVYNAAFERARLRDLAARFPDIAAALGALDDRIVDLLPMVRASYYHPSQQGSWSLKAVLPAIAPDLDYGVLDGVQDGSMAATAYAEAIAAETSQERKAELEQQLASYCRLDTEALVRIWMFLSPGKASARPGSQRR